MGKLYWSGVVLVIVIGLAVVVTFGLKGKTVPKIEWSHFADAKEVSDAVQLSLNQELKSFRIVFVGPHPDRPLHIDTSANLIEWLRSLGPHVLVADSRLLEKKTISADITLNLMSESERFLKGLKNIPPETRVIVWAPNIYVTHLLSTSPINQMQTELQKQNYVVLSFVTFPSSREAEPTFELPCQTGETDSSGFSELGCFIQGQARPHYRKEKIPDKTAGFLNHVRTQEFMLFLGQ